jgi:uncharacterized protein (DUF488 family)
MLVAGIGYQGRTLDQLVEALRAARIATLADVRERPASRKPGFSKRALEERLAREGIAYRHLRAAGNPSAIRHSGAPTAEILARYRDHLRRDPAVLDEIAALARRGRVALLCYEADRAACHRSVLLDALRTNFETIDL